MPTVSLPRFYVYALARPIKNDWRIFYIGKGSKRRVFRHEDDARKGCQCYKCRIIRKVWSDGGEIQRYILLTTDDEQEALAYEIEMIALHGRENLCNFTDGGEGASGYQQSEETRAKQSERRARPEVKAHYRQMMLRRYEDPDERAKQSARAKEALSAPDVRRRRIEASKANNADPIVRSQRSERQRAGMENPALRDRIRSFMKERMSNPTERSALSERMRQRYEDPEERAKTAEHARATWQDPDYRARQNEL